MTSPDFHKPTKVESDYPPEPETYQKYAYQKYGVEEDARRSASHYEFDPEVYYCFTGGEWNSYSCLMWEPGFTITQAQEKKLDKMAELMELKPGMKVLDVGCGWGGPLVYWAHKYGAIGHGITVTPRQVSEVQARAAKYNVPVTGETLHWKNLPEVETYDIVTSDGVLAHFRELGDFFAKCHKLLKPGGKMVHKELHLTHPQYAVFGPIGDRVSQTFNFATIHYVTLAQELQLVNDNNFQLRSIFEIPMPSYWKTLDEWQSNLFQNRERVKALVGEQVYKEFRAYFKGIRYMFTHEEMFNLHIIASRKMS